MLDNPDREAMILQWLPLAWKMAGRFRHTNLLFDDRRQEAILGLIHAVDTFDPERGLFKSFASKVICNKLMVMCAEQIRPYRVPMWLAKVEGKVKVGKLNGISPHHLALVRFLQGQRVTIDHDLTVRSAGRTP